VNIAVLPAFEVPHINAKPRPTAVKVEAIALKENKPPVIFGNEVPLDAVRFRRSEMPLNRNQAALFRKRMDFPVFAGRLFHFHTGKICRPE
jgi:hypothetical protein